MAIKNPWAEVFSKPCSPPFVLEGDREAVVKFNSRLKSGSLHQYFLHVEQILPEPFVGAKDAPVVLLSNNPGFNDEITIRGKQDKAFLTRIRGNLSHTASEYPLIFLDPDCPGSDWWGKKLHHIIEHFDALGHDGRKLVAKSILNIVYFPYPSRRFGHRRLSVPSQDYNFDLVRSAIRRDAVIIHLRQSAMWLDSVPELAAYNNRRFEVLNTQRPVITPWCPGFKESIDAIKKYMKL